MEAWVKSLIMLVVMLVWGAIMTNWVFIQHVKPDIISWSIPGAVYLTVYVGIPTKLRSGKGNGGIP